MIKLIPSYYLTDERVLIKSKSDTIKPTKKH